MPLMDHLGELRRRLTIVVVSVFVTAIVVYFATPALIEVLTNPIREFLTGGTLTVLSVLGGFSIRFKVAFFFAFIICTPIIIWEIMAFFLPALNEKERRWVVPTVAAMVFLFFFGMIFCYFIILNTAFGWLIQQSTEFAATLNEAEDYLSIIIMFEVGFGIALQLLFCTWFPIRFCVSSGATCMWGFSCFLPSSHLTPLRLPWRSCLRRLSCSMRLLLELHVQ